MSSRVNGKIENIDEMGEKSIQPKQYLKEKVKSRIK
uniref:Uncharacterized protein n=1 Tax=Parascaris equorum TaxID=6256 RepID=A0A914RPW0_PAREQ